MALKYSYYPGCSSHSTGKDFDESIKAVCGHLGIELNEVPDWNCCGASATHTADPDVAYNLGLRNLVIAEGMGNDDVITPCAACFAHLKHSEHEAKKRGGKGEAGTFTGKIRARNLLEVMRRDVGLETIAKNVNHPLVGLKAVSYYGCLMVRPPEITGMDHPEDPMFLDEIVETLGATPVNWSYKIDCCGGSMAIPRTDIVLKLTGKILDAAEEAEANCIVTACPLCQMNLDSRQAQINEEKGTNYNFPIYYYTELMGIAFFLPDYKTWLNRHITDPLPLIEASMKALEASK